MVTVNILSKGFFQQFCEGSREISQPVLQVLDVRILGSGNEDARMASFAQRYRFRLSDGCFSYNSVINHVEITSKITGDNLSKDNAAIKILRWDRRDADKPSANGIRKPRLIIFDYSIVARELSVLGNPTEHSGDANDYKGFDANSDHYNSKMSEQNASADIMHGGGSVLVQQTTPIKLITPYVNKWRICGVVTVKEDLRELKTARGEMRVFNFEISDKDGGCIRIAAFNEIADKYYSIIQKGLMYYIAGGTIKQANKRFNTTGHDYEISLRSDSEIRECHDKQKIVQPKLTLNAVPLSKVSLHVDQCIDIIGVVESVGEIQQLTSRSSGQLLEKRDITLVDQSGTSVVLTCWGDQAKKYDNDFENQAIAIKGCLVREYNGSLSLSVMNSSRIEFNPDCKETSALYSWYKNTRPLMKINSLSVSSMSGDSYGRDLRIIGIAEAIELGKNEEKGVYFNVTAIISSVKADGALYKSCGNGGCKKKVIAIDNQYRCEKCNVLQDQYKYVLILSMEISDFSGTHYVTIFEDKATTLLKATAEELGTMLDCDQTEEYNKVFNAVLFRQYNFRIRGKSEFYNDMERVKWTVFDVAEVPYDKYIDQLQRAITKLEVADDKY